MSYFSKRSLDRLDTCHLDLQRVFRAVVLIEDCTILEGHRTLARQAELLASGKSKVRRGKHNESPSLAVDVAPYPIDWEDTERFVRFAGVVMSTAQRLGVDLRWGGDWDGDGDRSDQTFDDLVHFELRS